VFLDRSRTWQYFNILINLITFELSFEAILHIYRSGGQVVRPGTVPVELFIDELHYYGLKDDVWANFCESEGCRIRPKEKEPENKLQRKVWHLVSMQYAIFIILPAHPSKKMEHPDSSPIARLLASLSVSVILM
jgi:hypothetical protein